MNTLSSLEIKNFQSLASSKVDLAPGLTCIVGPSNLGKSALTRALKALVRNAAASGLVRNGASKFVATATFSDGSKETLSKGSKESVFELELPGQPKFSHEKSGASKTPEEVSEFWALPKTDDRDIAFAGQHEPPFLLAEPASAVAKVIGDLTNASVLMEAVKRTNKRRADALSEEKVRRREYEEVKQELLTHTGLSKRKETLAEALAILSNVKTILEKREILATLVAERDSYLQQLADLDVIEVDIAPVLTAAETAVSNLVHLQELYAQYAALKNIDAGLMAAQESLTSQHTTITKKVDELMQSQNICPLCGTALCNS